MTMFFGKVSEEGIAYLLAGQSAVGNSRVVNRDVSNVSCKEVPDPFLAGQSAVGRTAE